MGGSVRALPEALGGRGLEQLFSPVAGDLAQSARSRTGEPLGFTRQNTFQFLLHVDVGVELIDEVVGDGTADCRVLQQLITGADPIGGI